jgi:hypothetical protein
MIGSHGWMGFAWQYNPLDLAARQATGGSPVPNSATLMVEDPPLLVRIAGRDSVQS